LNTSPLQTMAEDEFSHTVIHASPPRRRASDGGGGGGVGGGVGVRGGNGNIRYVDHRDNRSRNVVPGAHGAAAAANVNANRDAKNGNMLPSPKPAFKRPYTDAADVNDADAMRKKRERDSRRDAAGNPYDARHPANAAYAANGANKQSVRRAPPAHALPPPTAAAAAAAAAARRMPRHRPSNAEAFADAYVADCNRGAVRQRRGSAPIRSDRNAAAGDANVAIVGGLAAVAYAVVAAAPPCRRARTPSVAGRAQFAAVGTAANAAADGGGNYRGVQQAPIKAAYRPSSAVRGGSNKTAAAAAAAGAVRPAWNARSQVKDVSNMNGNGNDGGNDKSIKAKNSGSSPQTRRRSLHSSRDVVNINVNAAVVVSANVPLTPPRRRRSRSKHAVARPPASAEKASPIVKKKSTVMVTPKPRVAVPVKHAELTPMKKVVNAVAVEGKVTTAVVVTAAMHAAAVKEALPTQMPTPTPPSPSRAAVSVKNIIATVVGDVVKTPPQQSKPERRRSDDAAAAAVAADATKKKRREKWQRVLSA
jgi:hypothetical protein